MILFIARVEPGPKKQESSKSAARKYTAWAYNFCCLQLLDPNGHRLQILLAVTVNKLLRPITRNENQKGVQY